MLFSKKIIGSLDRPKTSAAKAEGRLLKSFGIGRLCSASVIVWYQPISKHWDSLYQVQLDQHGLLRRAFALRFALLWLCLFPSFLRSSCFCCSRKATAFTFTLTVKPASRDRLLDARSEEARNSWWSYFEENSVSAAWCLVAVSTLWDNMW